MIFIIMIILLEVIMLKLFMMLSNIIFTLFGKDYLMFKSEKIKYYFIIV